jgi:selenocysteine-specific elongation factor
LLLTSLDSGKTSLVKALSTSLSTAALDKNPQSQRRGITLDLGFSSFSMDIPPHLRSQIPPEEEYDQLQFTLVDCPGHASLIRTIIGGAQIIDMIVLVVDINKGIQTQTAECIVIGEITTDSMIIVLNKVDLIPPEERRDKIEKMSRRIRKIFSLTKFQDPAIIVTSAMIGGEKVAAVSSASSSGGTTAKGKAKKEKGLVGVGEEAAPLSVTSLGMEDLLDAIRSKLVVPKRDLHGPFHFSIDHCFAIKGHGTVLTGQPFPALQAPSSASSPSLPQALSSVGRCP